ncbi:hypothetical protein [Flavobacterium sp.]|uniref:hypothetical protein n=1 Tax=Flavobacterium sp. TaxID=239 RepID=UPI00286CBEAB|nr:hypothetical protein [Flavobacterium sp.]
MMDKMTKPKEIIDAILFSPFIGFKLFFIFVPNPAFRFSPHFKSFFSILTTGASFGRSVARRKNSF